VCCCGVVLLWYCAVVVLWYCGVVALWHCVVALWCCGVVVAVWWRCGVVVVLLWCCCVVVVALWWRCGGLWCCGGIVVLWWDCGVVVALWCCGGVVVALCLCFRLRSHLRFRYVAVGCAVWVFEAYHKFIHCSQKEWKQGSTSEASLSIQIVHSFSMSPSCCVLKKICQKHG
jgi:hypothetical protein